MYLCNRNKYLFPREMDFKGMCMLRLMSVFLTEYKSFFPFYPLCERMGGKKKYSVNEAFRAARNSR